MSRDLWSSLILCAGMAALAGAAAAPADGTPPRAPRFSSSDPANWIGAPATWENLRGRVVMLDVWTFG